MTRRHLIDQHIEQGEEDALPTLRRITATIQCHQMAVSPQRKLQLGAEKERHPSCSLPPRGPAGSQVQQGNCSITMVSALVVTSQPMSRSTSGVPARVRYWMRATRTGHRPASAADWP